MVVLVAMLLLVVVIALVLFAIKLARGVEPLRRCVADATNDDVADNDVANGLSAEKSKLIFSLCVFFGAAILPLAP